MEEPSCSKSIWIVALRLQLGVQRILSTQVLHKSKEKDSKEKDSKGMHALETKVRLR